MLGVLTELNGGPGMVPSWISGGRHMKEVHRRWEREKKKRCKMIIKTENVSGHR